MPGIKYKGSDGQWHLLNQVMVNEINVVQTTGSSSADVMSQSAVTEALENVHIDVDQVIDSGTSASTDAVSTSAVYGFVTSYTPSITVDQVMDSTTSASTNPVATQAVYLVIKDNEEVTAAALADLGDKVAEISGNSEIEVSSGVTPSGETIEIWIDESENPSGDIDIQSASAITAMTGYEIASSGSAITAADTLIEAIGKLEKRIAELEAEITNVEPQQTVQQVQGKDYYEIV